MGATWDVIIIGNAPLLTESLDRASTEKLAYRVFTVANEVRAADGLLSLERYFCVAGARSMVIVLQHLDRTGEEVFDCRTFGDTELLRAKAGTRNPVALFRPMFGREPHVFCTPKD